MKDGTRMEPAVSHPLVNLCCHLVLPPRLPGLETSTRDQETLCHDILHRVKDSVYFLSRYASADDTPKFNSILASLTASIPLNGPGAKLSAFQAAFRRLQPLTCLIIFIGAQNAGLLISRTQRESEDTVTFEVFEASPRSEDVFSTDGALRMVFPGSAHELAWSDFRDTSFQLSLARFLDLACSEHLPRFSARTRKAKKNAIEPRDTTNPELITTVLATLLEANGCVTVVSPIGKRVKDNVCWSQGAPMPWSRLPFYLVLRVGLRRCFQNMFGDIQGPHYYKLVITRTLSNLLRDLRTSTEYVVTFESPVSGVMQ